MSQIRLFASVALLAVLLSSCVYSFMTDREIPLDLCSDVPELDNAMLYGVTKNGERIDMYKLHRQADSLVYDLEDYRNETSSTARFVELEANVYLVQFLEKSEKGEDLITTVVKVEDDRVYFFPGEGYDTVLDMIVASDFPADRIRHTHDNTDKQAHTLNLADDQDVEDFINAMKGVAKDIPFSTTLEGEEVFMHIEQL